MATVYRAHDNRLGVDRAIKILSSQYSASANIRARFQSEARTRLGFGTPISFRCTMSSWTVTKSTWSWSCFGAAPFGTG
jgi:serine/threonine protein kinase